MDPLLNLTQLIPTKTLCPNEAPGSPGSQDGPSFRDLFQRALQEVDNDERAAAQEARNLMTGQGTDMHSAILAVQKAEVSFNTMMAVRSKLVDAYREVMRMQM
ncbi:MAG: flagellar hook-basal body complex protein FliE [Holophagales bacterium]|jgi:flagellar hook-basal body complex protein FliE|nr:flagellar hook-basal body complex protein FliE [Holophagales bacterium]